MSLHACCFKGFAWDGTPTGRVEKLGQNDVYVTGNNPHAAVLIVHDIFGWAFPNVRLLADAYASEGDLTVYVPDFFAGESLPFEPLFRGEFDKIDLGGFLGRNSREIREPEMVACARALRAKYDKVGAAGFCYGGWIMFRLAGKEFQPDAHKPLVDCVVAAHPSMLTKKDVDETVMPVQILAPELDDAFGDLKVYTFETLMKNGVKFDYQHFPGVEHGCLTRGDKNRAGEREAMERAKNAALGWFKQFLHKEKR